MRRITIWTAAVVFSVFAGIFPTIALGENESQHTASEDERAAVRG